jgi:hypothetical protein
MHYLTTNGGRILTCGLRNTVLHRGQQRRTVDELGGCQQDPVGEARVPRQEAVGCDLEVGEPAHHKHQHGLLRLLLAVVVAPLPFCAINFVWYPFPFKKKLKPVTSKLM